MRKIPILYVIWQPESMKWKALVGDWKKNPERSAFIKIHVGKVYYKSTDQTMTHLQGCYWKWLFGSYHHWR